MLFLYIQYTFCLLALLAHARLKFLMFWMVYNFCAKCLSLQWKPFPHNIVIIQSLDVIFFIFAFVVSIICRSGKISVSKLQLMLCNSSSSIILSLLFSSCILILCSLLDCQHFFYSFNASDGSEGTTAGHVVWPRYVIDHHGFRSKEVRHARKQNIDYGKQHHTPRCWLLVEVMYPAKSTKRLLVDSFNCNCCCWVNKYIYLYMNTYACIYICMYMCVYIYIHVCSKDKRIQLTWSAQYHWLRAKTIKVTRTSDMYVYICIYLYV